MHLTEEGPNRPRRSNPDEKPSLAEVKEMLDVALPAWSVEESGDFDTEIREGRLARIELKDAIESLIDPKFRVNIAGRDFAEAVKQSKELEEDMLTVFGDVARLLVRSLNKRFDAVLRHRCVRIFWAKVRRRRDIVESLKKEIPFMVRETVLVSPEGRIALNAKRLTGDAKLSEVFGGGGNGNGSAAGEDETPATGRAAQKAASRTFGRLALIAATNRTANRSVVYATGDRFALAASVQGVVPRRFHARLEIAIRDIEDYLRQEGKAAARLTAANTRRIRRNLTEILELNSARLEEPAPWVQSFGVLAAIGVAGLFAAATYGSWKESRWQQLIAEIESIPGIDVASASAESNPRLITGFRDALAADPTPLVEINGFDPGDVVLSLFPYRSPDPTIVYKRARKLLNPPDSVKLNLVNGTIYASGSAPHVWINQGEQLRPYLLPQTQLDLSAVVDVTLLSCRTAAEKLLAHRFDFDPAHRTGIIAREVELESTTGMILDLQELAKSAGVDLEIRLVGRHVGAEDPLGIESLRIGRERAEYVQDIVLSREPAIDTVTLRALAERPLPDTALDARKRNHAVEFAVNLNGEILTPGSSTQLSSGAY